jgi:predicted nucleic acid-binding protein
MTAGLTVCDASPLIALEQIGQLDLLRQLFGHVLVPPAVVRETRATLDLPSWIGEQSLGQPVDPEIVQAALGFSETKGEV